MKMQDAKIGDLMFLEERLGDDRSNMELRETFYRRTGPDSCALLGLVQGDPELATPAVDDDSKPIRPRFIRFDPQGHEYPLVGAMPVKPISESRFYKYVERTR